jgi:uncharacterized protein YukE
VGDVFWVNIPALRNAAQRLKEEARAQDAILQRLGSLNLTDPKVFGVEDKGGEEFHKKWSKDIQDWKTGTRGISEGTDATAEGVKIMAKSFEDAHDGAVDLATVAGKIVDNLTPLDPLPGLPPHGTGPSADPNAGGGTPGRRP